MPISFADLEEVMSFDTQGKFCVEIAFAVAGCPKYRACWMGKLFDPAKSLDVYWLGLTPDGNNAHEHPSFTLMAKDRVFDGKSLEQLWERIQISSIDGCDPQERMTSYRDCARQTIDCIKENHHAL